MGLAEAKQPYYVDLAGLMRTYETNYAKLNALLPFNAEVGDVRCYQVVNM
ncbi:dehydrogenase, partial [Vibrio vulnificus]